MIAGTAVLAVARSLMTKARFSTCLCKDYGRRPKPLLFRRALHFRIDAMGVLARIGAEERDHARFLEGEAERLPDVDQSLDQIGDLGFGMGRRRGHAQPLRPPGDGRIVDRLNVDRMPLEQEFARRAALPGVADKHRHDMRGIVHHRQTGGAQSVLDELRHMLVAVALGGRALQMLDRGGCARRTLGGRVEVKMNWGAKLLTASTIASLAAI